VIDSGIVNFPALDTLRVRGFSEIASLSDLTEDEDVSRTIFSTCGAFGGMVHFGAISCCSLGVFGQDINSSSSVIGVASG
jgi:hypothetical protein